MWTSPHHSRGEATEIGIARRPRALRAVLPSPGGGLEKTVGGGPTRPLVSHSPCASGGPLGCGDTHPRSGGGARTCAAFWRPRGQKLPTTRVGVLNTTRSAGRGGLRTCSRSCCAEIGCGHVVDNNCSKRRRVAFISFVHVEIYGCCGDLCGSAGGRVSDSLIRRRVRTMALAVSCCARRAEKRIVRFDAWPGAALVKLLGCVLSIGVAEGPPPLCPF